jgi:Mg2+/Co2+ transporter CorB
LIGCSAFFSSSETGLMTLNRYRLRHRAKAGDKAAQRVGQLLERPDRLIGLILLGNNFVNILASSLATIIAIHFLGDAGIAVSTLALTLVLLVFGEVAPKTLAALHPERIAYPASVVLAPLLKVFYPLVWLTNLVVNNLLRLFHVNIQTTNQQSLSAEELRTVVLEAGVMIPKRHQAMLLGILELEEITVNDIMVPRNEIEGIDLEDEWPVIVEQTDPQPLHPLAGLPRHHRSGRWVCCTCARCCNTDDSQTGFQPGTDLEGLVTASRISSPKALR